MSAPRRTVVHGRLEIGLDFVASAPATRDSVQNIEELIETAWRRYPGPESSKAHRFVHAQTIHY
jgi:hypothetical protein